MEYDDGYLLITGRGKGEKGGRVLLVDRDLKGYRLWFSGLNGPHDGIFLPPDFFVFSETNGSSVAILKRRRFLKPKIVSRLYMPYNVNKYWTRGLAADTKGNLLVGRSVWQGDKDNRYASVVQITQDGTAVKEHKLEIEDYPECRIYQIILAP